MVLIPGLYVLVCAYVRYRLGRWEVVKTHHHRWPKSKG